VVGQNLYTWTNFTGWDPDQGSSGTPASQIYSSQSSAYPQSRNFRVTFGSKF